MSAIKRKKYLINKGLQFQIIGFFLLAITISLLVFTIITVVYYWIQGMAGENIFKEYITIYKQTTEMQEIVRNGKTVLQAVSGTVEIPGVKRWELIVPALILNNVVIVVMFMIMGLFFSHRIAGPVYRIQTNMAKSLSGERGVRIKLRKKDKLESLAAQTNLVLEELDKLRGE